MKKPLVQIKNLLVVDNINKLSIKLLNTEIISAREYLLNYNPENQPKIKVFNLCNSFRYQSEGYYVSLLAEARNQKPVPSISTIQDLKSTTIIKHFGEEIEELIGKQLSSLKSEKFVLSIYFGMNIAKKYDKLSSAIFRFFHAPLMQAFFTNNNNKWALQNINSISLNDIPENHQRFFLEAAKEYFSKERRLVPRKTHHRYDMAILYDPHELHGPSNLRAIKKFVKAAHSLGISTEIITKEDFSKLAEFDMLFIRETTQVNHHTYRFSRKADSEDLVVIDDPLSILRCCNKVYLTELLAKNNLLTPKTMILHSKNYRSNDIIETLNLPIVLKQPDSSFSQGVVKVETKEEYIEKTKKLLSKSDLIIAQQFLPTEYDWRIGIIDRVPIYACKYYMARKHWQIIKSNGTKKIVGNSETFPIDVVPKNVIRTALKAANLIGDGLYGVDLKQIGDEVFVIEVNDNPSIDAGFEDAVLKDTLYLKIMSVFLQRIEMKKFKVVI